MQAQTALVIIILGVSFAAVGTRGNGKNQNNVYRLQNRSVSIVSFNSHKNHLKSA